MGWGHTGILSPLWSRRETGTQLECRVSVVMIGLPSTLGLRRSGFAPHPLMREVPQGVPEAAGRSSSAVGGQCQVGTAAAAQCSQLQSRDSSSLLCPPPLSPLVKDFPELHLVSTSLFSLSLPWEQVGSCWLLLLHLAGRLVIPRPGLFCSHTRW